MASALAYRNDLQALRALAVAVVFLFHLLPDVFRGGFVGVDVFFVISGFLITSLILKEIENSGSFSLAFFWSRRLRRLLPAATLVLISSLYLALTFIPQTDWIKTAKQVYASALYFQNWMLVSQSVDYMAREANPTVVQHYWSLSIEEQFYFAWPLLLFFCALYARKTGKSARHIVFGCAIFIFTPSLIWSAFLMHGAPEGYFTTTTRAWELALGAALSAAWPRVQAVLPQRVLISWFGLIMVLASVLFIRQGMEFPGWIALVPTLGTAFLICGNEARFAAASILALKPICFIGDISYAIYLWHWPVLVISRQIPRVYEWPGWLQGIVLVAATLLLSVLTKYLVEDPFRDGFLAFYHRSQKRFRFVALSFLTAVILIGAAAGFARHHWKKEEQLAAELMAREKAAIYPPSDYPGAAAMDPYAPAPVPKGLNVKPNPLIAEHDMNSTHAHCMGLTGSFAVTPCEFGDRNGRTTIVLVGDSHAMQYGTALEKIAKWHAWRLVVLTKPACPFGDFPVFWEGALRSECEYWKKESLKILIAMKPDAIITTTARAIIYNELPAQPKQVEGYRRLWQKLLDQGIRVAVIRDNPLMRGGPHGWMSPPGCVYHFKDKPQECAYPRKKALEELADIMVTTAREMPAVSVIDLSDLFCTKEICPAVIGNILVYRDRHHISDTYGKTLAPYLDKLIGKILTQPAPNRAATASP